MRIGSLFAGIGGFDLAARWMGWSTEWYSEIEPYACRVMQKNFPGVPNLGDITKLSSPPPVDVLVGGFPCQDISAAGKGVGIGGERSGLWKHYARIIGEVRPRYVVIENSPLLRKRGLGVVLQDLAAIGFDAEWHCVPASAVGAPHQRDRIWIVAYANSERLDQPILRGGWLERGEASSSPRKVDAVDADRGTRSPRVSHVADAMCSGLTGDEWGWSDIQPADGSTGCRWGRQWATEPAVCRVAHGVPSRVDRLRCLGNAVVPQVPYMLFQAIAAHG